MGEKKPGPIFRHQMRDGAITEFVYDRSGTKCKVEKVVSLNPNQVFILYHEVGGSVHEDGSPAVYMLDPSNEAVYPDTDDVRALLKMKEQFEKKLKIVQERLDSHWLHMFQTVKIEDGKEEVTG